MTPISTDAAQICRNREMPDWLKQCLIYEVPIRTAPPEATMVWVFGADCSFCEYTEMMYIRDMEDDLPWLDIGGES